jgi:hypothetical protein
MSKKELLQEAINAGNEYGYISWDGLLDLTDEDGELINWLSEELEKMSADGKIGFELDF